MRHLHPSSTSRTSLVSSVLASFLVAVAPPVLAAASADEVASLSTTLTPLGGERAGNKDGSIPAWTGAPIPYTNYTPGGRRPDPFASDKPLFSVTDKNAAQHADKLTDGVKAMLKKYPESFRLDVYPTRRSGAAPQSVYDHTAKNATRATLKNGALRGAYGGIPFPIPKSGEEVMWNSEMRWIGINVHDVFAGYLTNSNGQRVLVGRNESFQQSPYYYKDGNPEALEKSGGVFTVVKVTTTAPPLRAGEAIVGHLNLDPDKQETWVYFTGQRRVRKLPDACCDTPNSTSAGQMTFDELNVWNSRKERFDWKVIGKREMLIPYNANKTLTAASDEELLGKSHLNPDHVRWELHRVWVVEATLKPNQRHPSVRSRYYMDEDTWIAVLGDRWDANGQLGRTLWAMPFAMPDLPGVSTGMFGFTDLLSGTWFAAQVNASSKIQYNLVPPLKESAFSPDALTGEGLR